MATIDQINQDMQVRAGKKWAARKQEIAVRGRAKRRFKRIRLFAKFCSISVRILFVGLLILKARAVGSIRREK